MHSKFRFVFVLAAVLFAVSPAFSQKKFTPLGNMSVGMKISTLGYGLEAATPLNNMLMLRLGINLTNGISFREYNFVFFDKNDQFFESFDYVPELRIKPGIDFSHGNLLLDFHPAGIFHLTAGAFVGKSHLKVEGRLVDSENHNSILLPGKIEWPVIEIAEDQRIDLTDGQARLDLQMGNTFKPYLGIGIGRAVPKNRRIAFKFELGVVFQRGYTLRQNEAVFDLTVSDVVDLTDIHNKLIKYGALWPMINFQLSYRIF